MRYLTDESTYIFGQFDSGDTVTITVYKASDASVIVNAAACTHLASGIFKYLFSDSVVVKTEYLYVMTNSTEEHAGKIILGGYPDTIKDQISRILTATEIRQASVNDLSASSTKFITTLTEAGNTFWNRGSVLFTSGANAGQIRAIKNYAGATKEITIQTPLFASPGDGDKFIIICARKFLTPDSVELADQVKVTMEAAGSELDDLHKLQGLDAANLLTVTPSNRSVGTINQTISGDGTSITTVQRS